MPDLGLDLPISSQPRVISMTDNPQLEGLLQHQRAALEHVRNSALRAGSGLRAKIISILEGAGLDEGAYDNAITTP